MPHTDCSPKSNIYSGSVTENWETSIVAAAMGGLLGIPLTILLAMTKAEERAHQRYSMNCPQKCPLKMGLYSIRVGRVRTKRVGAIFKVTVTVSWKLLVKCLDDEGQSHPAPFFKEWNELRELIAGGAPE